MIPRSLDHLVYAVPDLARGVADIAERLGVTPTPGGSHLGLGTANQLIGLGGSAYLEIIGPDPAQPGHAGPRPFGVDPSSAPRLVTWAIRPPDLDAVVAAARAGGYDPGAVRAMSRRTPDGGLLEWRLTVAEGAPVGGGLVPFLIDWGATPHPASGDVPVVALHSVRATFPDPERIRTTLRLLGTELDVVRGTSAALAAVVEGAHGPVPL